MGNTTSVQATGAEKSPLTHAEARRRVNARMNPGLYAIVDADTLEGAGRDVTDFARRVLDAGPLAALQLRAKSWGARRMLTCARDLAALCRARGVPFFVNDRPDVAWLARATKEFSRIHNRNIFKERLCRD